MNGWNRPTGAVRTNVLNGGMSCLSSHSVTLIWLGLSGEARAFVRACGDIVGVLPNITSLPFLAIVERNK
jgi:hypothetical protein